MLLKDEDYMKRAFSLAERARGNTSPNPMVGCVIVKKNRVIAEGFHRKAGLPHAEIEALSSTSEDVKGAVMYLNLEPCFHWGKTPPCVDRIISSGIKKIVVSVKDPNPEVQGKSIAKMRRKGIKVVTGVLEKEAGQLNEVFFKNMREGLPFVAAKIAQTLDGKTANSKGESKWITSSYSRRYARKLRGEYDAVLVGANTVRKDNPRLTCPQKKMVKVILSSSLNVPLNARLFRNARAVYIFTPLDSKHLTGFTKEGMPFGKLKQFKNKAEIFGIRAGKSGISLKSVLKRLYSLGVMSLFVEGGSSVLGSFFDSKFVDKLYVFTAPKIMGKREAIGAISGKGNIFINRLVRINNFQVTPLGKDYLFTGYPVF